MEINKVAVLNNSGNVGKSTICDLLLKPRMDAEDIIKIETLNSDGTDDSKVSAKLFDEILERIDISLSCVIDIGSSNVETFYSKLESFKGSSELIDLYLIPVDVKEKQQIDSVNTIGYLLALDIPIENIKVVFNMVEVGSNIESVFATYFNKVQKITKAKHLIKVTDIPVIYYNDIFSLLLKYDLNYHEVKNDDRDFRQLMKEATITEERRKYSNIRAVKMLMAGFEENLDEVYRDLKI